MTFTYNAELLTSTRNYLLAVIQAEAEELERNLSQPRTPDLDHGVEVRTQRIEAYTAALAALPRLRADGDSS